MNIKISKEEHEQLLKWKIHESSIGSQLYGTAGEDSDTDVLCFYNPSDQRMWETALVFPSQHQFQYDDKENNTQYIWTNILQFWRNLNSGDSTINADVVMFGSNPIPVDDVWRLRAVRNYKVIKAFIGFAKRDLRNHKGKNKLFHAERSLYCAECLLNNELPTLEGIRFIADFPSELNELKVKEALLRRKANKMHDDGSLKTYTVHKVPDALLQKLLDSNNIREFKYED